MPICKELNRRKVLCVTGQPWKLNMVRRMLINLGYDEPSPTKSNEREAKARDEVILPLVRQLRSEGLSMTEAAAELNRLEIWTGRGGTWTGRRLWNFWNSRHRRAVLVLQHRMPFQ
jgi:hypothetical protein